MRLFEPDARTRSPRHRRLYALYEIAFTIADVSAALLFVIGSILFFDQETTYAGTWCFLLGSVCFALKPMIRLVREFHFWRVGEIGKLAERGFNP